MVNEQPNILLLLTDQQRFDTLCCAGNERITTPHLDALAASGVRFSHAFTPTPVCVAARMSLITGHRAGRTHWVDNGKVPGPAPELPTLMTLLHAAGYRTHAAGKLHFGGRHYGLQSIDAMEEVPEVRIDDDYLRYLKAHHLPHRYPHGIRDLLYYQPQTVDIPAEHAPNHWVAERAIDFLKDHVRYRRQPFFLWASWIAPHPPFAPCEPYASMYDPAAMPPPSYPDRPITSLPSPAWVHRGRLDGAHLDKERMRRIRALYYGLISHVDAGIGRILQTLEALGLRDNTVVIFTSDHGDMLGDHGLSQKNVPYEPSVRIPLILRWPGRTAEGRVSHDLVGLTDLLPTVIQGAKLDYLPEAGPLPEESLLFEEGGGLASRRDGYVIDYGWGRTRWLAVRTQTHLYALWAAGGREELYDLRTDPEQRHDLIATEPELAARLRSRALLWERQNGLADSFDGENFRVYAEPEPPAEPFGTVVMNQARWPERLPEDEKGSVESFAEAFTSAISKEKTLSPEKLSLDAYRKKGGDLTGTPWEEA